MRIINAAESMHLCFEGEKFDISRWKKYMDTCAPGAKQKCLDDMQECLNAGYTWEKDYLPVLNGVMINREKREEVIRSFCTVTQNLENRILSVFGKNVDADIVLYLGLCCGAGWVTQINQRVTILLGIEKIVELDWCSVDAMNGLILHELGHVYQAQHGVISIDASKNRERYLWQLFTEGVAMVFEQEMVGNRAYFHQDRDGWKEWCEQNEAKIASAFYRELDGMTREKQQFFGDWVCFEGMPDVGYYLGARLVRFLMNKASFEQIIACNINDIEKAYSAYLAHLM